MTDYFCDIEVAASFFECGFLSNDVSQDVIDYYIKLDMEGASLEQKEEFRNLMGFKYFLVHKDFTNEEKNLALTNFCNHIVRDTNILITYNGTKYDNLMIDFIVHYLDDLITLSTNDTVDLLKNLSDEIINTRAENARYVLPYFKDVDSYYVPHDIMTMHNLHKARVSLKHLCIITKHYRIQDLPYNHTQNIPLSEMYSVLDYNFNDIIALRKVYYYDTEEIDSRYLAAKEWGLPLSKTLSASRAKLASLYLREEYALRANKSVHAVKGLRTYRRYINYADIIDPNIKFKTTILNDFLIKLKSKGIAPGEEFGDSVLFGGVRYDIKLGGLHSKDRPDIFISDDNYTYIDGDVDSFYPFVILNLKICPKHLDPDIFLPWFRSVVEERIICKKEGLPRAAILKLVINAIFGKFKDEMDMLYDPLATYKTTLNGQLYLLVWIESLYLNGLKPISANTDGVVTKVGRDQTDIYKTVTQEWADTFGFTMSFTEYTKYVRLNVNTYMAIDIKNKIKTKGTAFTDKLLLDKGFDTPVVAKALQNYFSKGVPIEDTIRNHNDIYDFTLTQKAGSQYEIIYNVVNGSDIQTKHLQKTNRFYASRKGYQIFKLDKHKNKLNAFYKNIRLFPLNDVKLVDSIEDFNINYDFYITKTTHLLESIYHLNTKQIKGSKSKSGILGNLFKDEDFYENPLTIIEEGTVSDISNFDTLDDDIYLYQSDDDDNDYRDDVDPPF